jgi:hypothetical protein
MCTGSHGLRGHAVWRVGPRQEGSDNAGHYIEYDLGGVLVTKLEESG